MRLTRFWITFDWLEERKQIQNFAERPTMLLKAQILSAAANPSY